MRLIFTFSILSFFFVVTIFKAGAAPEEMMNGTARPTLFGKISNRIKQVRESAAKLKTSLMKLKNFVPCKFEKMQLLCCVKTFMNQICFKIVFSPEDSSARASLQYGDNTFIERTFKGKNPPPMCSGMPFLQTLSLCLSLRSVTTKDNTLISCAYIEARLATSPIFSLNLNCLKIGQGGIEFDGSNEETPLVIEFSTIYPLLTEDGTIIDNESELKLLDDHSKAIDSLNLNSLFEEI